MTSVFRHRDGGQRIEAYALAEGAFRLAARLDSGESGALPPFADLVVVATSLWP